MKRKSRIDPSPSYDNPVNHNRLKQISGQINACFNKLPPRIKKVSFMLAVATIALICTTMIIHALAGKARFTLSIDNITLPKKLDMEQTPQDEKLIPVGKMKGMIEGEYESFYLAVDRQGHAYINRNPNYTEERFLRSNGWQAISREQLDEYEKQLDFLPARKNAIKQVKP